MPERVMFEFDIQTEATVTKEHMKQLVETALSCSLRDGDFLGGLPAYVTDLLGMRIYLRQTRGIGNTGVFALHGSVEELRFFRTPEGVPVDWLPQHLDQGIIDLLEVHGAGRWHVPSEAEHEATRAFESGYLDDISGVPPRDA